MFRAIAALQDYYLENPSEVETLTKCRNANEDKASGRKPSAAILNVYSAYRRDLTVLTNLEQQIKGFAKALTAETGGSVMSRSSDSGESACFTQLTSTPTTAPALQRSTRSFPSTQTRSSHVVKLAYRAWNLARRNDIRRLAGRALRLPLQSNSLLEFISEMATQNTTFALDRRTYLQEKLLPYLSSGKGHESSADGVAAVLGYCDLICKYPKWKTLSKPGPRIFKKLRQRGFRLLESPCGKDQDLVNSERNWTGRTEGDGSTGTL
jgi:hypothetical protein